MLRHAAPAIEGKCTHELGILLLVEVAAAVSSFHLAPSSEGQAPQVAAIEPPAEKRARLVAPYARAQIVGLPVRGPIIGQVDGDLAHAMAGARRSAIEEI